MEFSLSTHWNASRHETGEEMVDEILEMGIDSLELGYNLGPHLVDGVTSRVRAGAVKVPSVHNYCPVPPGNVRGHPELYTLGSTDWRERESALLHTSRTIRFAAEIGARSVVMHCGNIRMRNLTHKLVKLAEGGKRFTNRYERVKHKLLVRREKKAPRQLDHLYRGLERLIPVLSESGVRLGLENLPTYEAIPTEFELAGIMARFGTDHLCYWHDTGHAQIRANLGLIDHRQVLTRFRKQIGGMHVHDVAPPATDHVMPPNGHIDFVSLAEFGQLPITRVLEPSPHLPASAIAQGLALIRKAWTNQNPA